MDRQRLRRTLGSGPPPDLLFGEPAYSDADGLLHVGRPDGTVRSFGESGEAGPHTHDYAALVHGHPWSQITDTPTTFPPSTHTHDIRPIVIPLTPIGGFFPYAVTPGFRNELRVWPTLGKAILRFGLQSPNALPGTALSWTAGYSLGPNEFLLAPSRASFSGVWNPANQFTIIQGNNLLWVTQATVGQQIDFLVGNVEIFF